MVVVVVEVAIVVDVSDVGGFEEVVMTSCFVVEVSSIIFVIVVVDSLLSLLFLFLF